MKFGGTSLESVEAIERVCAIVKSRGPRHPVVVVSALAKVTDGLLALASDGAAGRTQKARERLVWLRDLHSSVASSLVGQEERPQLEDFLESHFEELEQVLAHLEETRELTAMTEAAVASFGERLSSRMMAAALRKSNLKTAHFDSRTLICTDDQHTQSNPLLGETYANVRRALAGFNDGIVPVLGGFIGSTARGVTTTLGRNSSNLTAVLVAAGVAAEEVEIWTDVDGVFRHDPREIGDQYPVEELCFDEALVLARRGAKVLHLGSILLAQQENIPVWIKNSRRPELRGTRIAAKTGLMRAAEVDGCMEQYAAGSD
ncbi:MAG TPA: aspartate kinase [Sphingomicrobium sp.]|nr:aspartate kinase [Sphingomicrobium sp.]